MKRLAYTMALLAPVVAAGTAAAQTRPAPNGATNESVAAAASSSEEGSGGVTTLEEVVVTATRRSERLQDVPLSVTAFSQSDLTQKGIVGYEGIARETPGAVLNVASDNNSRLTARGISTNGWGAGLQTTTTTYLDELPLTTIGNTVTLNPNLYDIERVEFLRGPQGTLFGSGSLSGALRILTHSPDLSDFDASALVDLGHTPDGGGTRQRYNGMVNVPLVTDTLGLRVVGFHRDEDGYIDNIGTGVKNSNSLKDSGGRAILLWKPTDRLRVRLLGSYEDSHPQDASLLNPNLGERKRLSTRPDLYTSKTQIYNATVDYHFDFADLTSSSTYSISDSLFDVDLAGTFAGTVPFFLLDTFQTRTFVQEMRLVSNQTSKLDWVLGGFYLNRDVDLDGLDQSSAEFLTARGITGLPSDATFSAFGSETRTYELAAFGDLTYHFTDKLAVSGGVRRGRYGATVDTKAGFNTAYFTYALFGIRGPLALAPIPAATSHYPSAERTSWKGSVIYEPSRDLTTYITVATGYRTPVYNARAGSVSTVNPNDLIIPAGAGSDDLTNYEIGLKGRWLAGKLNANLAAYYIDWRNIQVQANRPSDSVQFATNVGRAESKGLEAEITVMPMNGLLFGLNGSVNRAKVTKLSPEEAVISGAVKGSRLASPHLQGSFYGTYNYKLAGTTTGFTSFQIQHVGSFPNGFPNSPGTQGTPSPLYGFTDSYTYANVQTGIGFGKMTATLYVENLGNSDGVVYIHPEAFVDSRYAIVRPRTFGVRLGYQF
ncbi:MAG TPA: TonB-dependent receptor [Steroidobacteraceae bacterium]|nr:TonB-dependent receptor [Steroidobacteraceae bacterium]